MRWRWLLLLLPVLLVGTEYPTRPGVIGPSKTTYASPQCGPMDCYGEKNATMLVAALDENITATRTVTFYHDTGIGLLSRQTFRTPLPMVITACQANAGQAPGTGDQWTVTVTATSEIDSASAPSMVISNDVETEELWEGVWLVRAGVGLYTTWSASATIDNNALHPSVTCSGYLINPGIGVPQTNSLFLLGSVDGTSYGAGFWNSPAYDLKSNSASEQFRYSRAMTLWGGVTQFENSPGVASAEYMQEQEIAGTEASVAHDCTIAPYSTNDDEAWCFWNGPVAVPALSRINFEFTEVVASAVTEFVATTAYAMFDTRETTESEWMSLLPGRTDGLGTTNFFVTPGPQAAITDCTGTESMLASSAGFIENVYVNVGIAPGAGTSFTVTLWVGGSATACTGSIANTDTDDDFNCDSIAFAVGDAICLAFVEVGAAASPVTLNFGMEIRLTQ